MSVQVKLKRGSTAKITKYVGAEGTLSYDVQTKNVYAHDGVTVGGKLVTGLSGLEVKALIDKINTSPSMLVNADYNSNALLRYDIAKINGSTTSRGAQAFAFDERTRDMYLSEGGAISRYRMDSDVSVSPADASLVNGTAVGHQGLAIEYLPVGFKLWSTSGGLGRAAGRFDYTPGVAIDTAEVYELFQTGAFANSTSCTPAISRCGRYLTAHGTRFGTAITVVRVFELAKLVAGGPGNYTAQYLYEWETQGLVDASNPMQGMACDGSMVYMIAGGTGFGPEVNKRLHVYSMRGELISKENNLTVGSAAAALDATGVRYEPEGLAILGSAGGQQQLMVGMLSGDPGSRRFRLYQLNTAQIMHGLGLNLYGNVLSRLYGATGAGRQYVGLRANWDLPTGAGTNWYGNGDSINPGSVVDFTGGLSRRITSMNGQTRLSADVGVAPLMIDMGGSGPFHQVTRNGTQYGYQAISTADYQIGAVNGADLRLATAELGTFTGTVRWRIHSTTGEWLPFGDNMYSIGSATWRVKDITLGTAPIVTSDERLKDLIDDVSDELLDVWELVVYQTFKYRDAMLLKGTDGARWHVGVIAQRVKAAFELKGLDAAEYGLLCHQVWEDQLEPIMGTRVEDDAEGNLIVVEYDTGQTRVIRAAGDAYAIRYEEALSLEAALTRRSLVRVTTRLEAVEQRLAALEQS